MIWDIDKAKAYMFQMGMEHIESGLNEEGGELIYEAKWGDGCSSENKFATTIKRICWWENESIEKAIKEVDKISSY